MTVGIVRISRKIKQHTHMNNSYAKFYFRLSLAMLLMAVIFWILGDKESKYWFSFLCLYFDLKSHLYRIQDNA
jgi:hypothetical protein